MFNKKNEKINTVNTALEKGTIKELAFIMGDKKEIFKRNLIAGIGRGIGYAIRFYNSWGNSYLFFAIYSKTKHSSNWRIYIRHCINSTTKEIN